MLDAFARLIAGLFPAISPAAAAAFRKAQSERPPMPGEMFATQLPAKICQGDVVGPLTFVVQRPTGEFGEVVAPGMLLSHSCDFDNDTYVLFSPVRPFRDYAQHKARAAIKRNTYFSTLYLEAAPELGDVVVDLAIVQSLQRTVLVDQLANGAVRRIASLTALGYYLLAAKLALRMLRPQPPEEVRGISDPSGLQRVVFAFRAMRGVFWYVAGKE